ncbi:MAG TPA: DUF6677 family protein [Bryobacteraceae bacterium]|nr:DUF6677 family protein [Bryobacteraceae bacterium]
MMPATIPVSATAVAPLRPPFLVVAVGWLIPGGGHFLLGRRGRAAIVFGAVLVPFVIGVLMRGPLFQPTDGGDVLSRFIQYGGFVGDLASGLFYLGARTLGYAPPDIAAHAADYGSKFIVGAGLLNILAMVDAYEITTRLKD